MDIGTGSGIIPISIASNVEIPNVIGTDISYEALEVAAENTRRTLQIEPGLNIKENFGSCID